MPDWMIKIGQNKNKKKAGGPRIKFSPNPQQVLAGDIINWRNDDTEPHWPAPIQNGQLNKTGYLNNQIPPGATSDKAFSPEPVTQDTELEYGCALHPDEKGIIRVLLTPPSLAVAKK